ncbi:fluoride efflux transporter CrcB [Cohnella lubricantis]|uniref:Fluoride-specific ion channel FluC n=1 Tax=Cohnella lubricantis TaxID=2163172 RepID=A0A841T984_9BACL|nr:fluoride efflux transporter CrcB [Cohnella lubricantis]MBB6677864.1 fluoride efflux transporter CrcB [Cohnella lubricantis]MBP2119044.1 CrcB protein [Cohnella lubricantis]
MIENMVCVAIGGFFGACARFGLSAWASRKYPSALPWATLLINLSGSFLLGIIAGSDWSNDVHLLLGTGFMGAYTTFSTFNVDNVQLFRKREWKALAIYLLGSYVFGIALAYAGYLVGKSL